MHFYDTLEWSFNTLAKVLTCLSGITNSGSFAIAIQCNHSNIIVGVWEQLLQQGLVDGPWHQNLQRDIKHVRNRHFRRDLMQYGFT